MWTPFSERWIPKERCAWLLYTCNTTVIILSKGFYWQPLNSPLTGHLSGPVYKVSNSQERWEVEKQRIRSYCCVKTKHVISFFLFSNMSFLCERVTLYYSLGILEAIFLISFFFFKLWISEAQECHVSKYLWGKANAESTCLCEAK